MLENAINQSPDVEVYFLALLMCGAIYLTINKKCKDHPGKVYTIWYLYFLTATIVSFLFYYIFKHLKDLENTYLASDKFLGIAAKAFVDTSTNIGDEFKLLGFIFIIGVVPQITSYVISGLFGCGSPPRFISNIVDLVSWALIKFCAVFAGIVLAFATARLLAESPTSVDKFGRSCCQSVIIISAAFMIMWAYYNAIDVYKDIVSHESMRRIRSIHRFFVRNTNKIDNH